MSKSWCLFLYISRKHSSFLRKKSSDFVWMQQLVSVYADDFLSENTTLVTSFSYYRKASIGLWRNSGIVSLLEVLGRQGQGPFVELLTVYMLLFTQGLRPKLWEVLDGTFIQHRGALYTPEFHKRAQGCGCTTRCHLLQQLRPVCQTCEIPQ